MPRKRMRAVAVTTFTAAAAASLFLGVILLQALPAEPYPASSICWRGNAELIEIHDANHAGIAAEYFGFSALAIALFVRTRAWHVSRAFPVLAVLVAAFVVGCGVTHLLARVELYKSVPTAHGWALRATLWAGAAAIVEFLRKFPDLELWIRGIAAMERDFRQTSRLP